MEQAPISLDPRLYAAMLETLVSKRAQFETGEALQYANVRFDVGNVPVLLRFTVEKPEEQP